MLSIALSSEALNSASLCWAVRPSDSAREKLAIIPFCRARRVLASSRLDPPDSATSYGTRGCFKSSA